MPNIQFFDSIDSTHSYSKKHLDEFEQDTLNVVWAKNQTKGVGRKNDKWISEIGNLFFTFTLFAPDFEKSEPLIFVCALSVIKVLKKRGVVCELKWPNDLLLSRKKVGGVMANVVSHGEKKAVMVGLGLNVNLKDVSEIDRPATSIFLETKEKMDVEELGFEIISQFEKDASDFFANGFDSFYEHLLKCAVHRPKDLLTIDLDGKKIKAQFHSITQEGFLKVEVDGAIKILTTGTIDAF